MKKIFVLLLAAIVLFSSLSLAGELSTLSDDELMELYTKVTEEMAGRKMAAPEETPDSHENAEEEPRTEQAGDAAEVPGDTVLYYHPEGGQYYHTDPNCRRVNDQYLPLSGSFSYDELEKEAYKDLQPCETCGAPARPSSPRFRDAAEAAGEAASVGGDIDYLALVTEKDGKHIRMVTLFDDRASELYMAVMEAEDASEAYDAFYAYAWSLPVSYTEEITEKPKEQEELDAQNGKTVGELLSEGYTLYGSGGGMDLPTSVVLSYGMFAYEFEADASFREYQELMESGDLESLRVKNGKRSGYSGNATDLDWLADGTYEPQPVPNVTAEEASAVPSVPPLEEYSRNAWPLTPESYADLLKNTEDRYGRVYMVEGTVHQVISQIPLRVIINTGADGKTQPVVIEYPGQDSFRPEEGVRYRIYADVSSACYLLPVLTARYTFSGGTTDPAD